MRYDNQLLRHELKYYINYQIYHELRQRLKVVIQADPHMPDEEGYKISSLYFDDMYHSAMEQKLAGVRFRKKFRMRCYNSSDRVIRLECKYKYDNYIAKRGAPLTRMEYNSILSGDYGFLMDRTEKVCQELFCYNRTRQMKPTVVVDYLREAYISPLGNVRITFDKSLEASSGTLDMFSEEYMAHSVLPGDLLIMEVKYDDYIPTHILSIIQTAMTDRCAISKYVMCRLNRKMVKHK